MGFRKRWKAPRSLRSRRLSRGGGGRRSRPASRSSREALQPPRDTAPATRVPGRSVRRGAGRNRPVLRSRAPGPSVRLRAWVSAHAAAVGRAARRSPGIPVRHAQATVKAGPAGADHASVIHVRSQAGARAQAGDQGGPRSFIRARARVGSSRVVLVGRLWGCRSRTGDALVERSERPPLPNRTRAGADDT